MPKSRNRDGVYERPGRKGFWISYVDENGRRHQTYGGPTTTQAREERQRIREKVRKRKQAIEDGETLPSDDTFADVSKRFLDYQRKQHVAGKISQVELNRQTGIVANHLNRFFGSFKIAQINRPRINAYVEHRTGNVSAGTIIKEANTLKRMFHLAHDKWALIPKNPAKGIDLPEAPTGRTRHLDPKDLQKLLHACPEWLRPIVGLAVSTGARRGELLKIQWAHVDVKGGRILLPVTKNKQPRFAYLNRPALQVILFLEADKRSRMLFPDVTPAQVTVAFIRACKAAGIEDFSMHDLRHTYASQLRMQGVDLHTLGQLLGHKDLRMTARYSHLSPEFLGTANGQLDNVFTEPLLIGPNKNV
jgi:integrase